MKKLYKALENNIVTVQDIKSKYGVSSRTVHRWASNDTKPKVEIQYELEKLLDRSSDIWNNAQNANDEARISKQIDNLLISLRESFYRWGNYSSRNEALEDLSKMLLAQFYLIGSQKEGFHTFQNCGNNENTNALFIEYINDSVKEALGNALTKDVFKNGDYNLLLSFKNSKLVREVCDSFKLVEWEKIQSLNRLDIFNEIFGRFLADSFVDEKEMGQYLTPIEMTRFIVSLAISTIKDDQYEILINPEKCADFGLILDPSCGAGSFLSEIVQQLLPDVIQHHGIENAKVWLSNMGKFVLAGIDKSPKMVRLAVCNLSSMRIPCDNIIYDNTLKLSSNWSYSRKLDNNVALILTNPPFGAEFRGNDLLDFKLFTTWATRPPKKIDSELLFIERYTDWLKENGNCITVVPDSVLTNKNLFSDLRRGIQKSIEINAVVSFPPETFSSAGTSTKTSVLAFEKTATGVKNTYFGICRNIGFKVITKGSNRTKVKIENSDLDAILLEATSKVPIKLGRRFKFDDGFYRWDATYHALLNEAESAKLSDIKEHDVKLVDLVDFVSDKCDPRRAFETFHYIEISSISKSCEIKSKKLLGIEAPSRARKTTKLFDVLASTVRPNQKKVGYVVENHNDLICTTGLVVMRPKKNISPLLICKLLKSDFVTKQLLRNNVGIAYPTVEEKAYVGLLLPINKKDLDKLNNAAKKIEQHRNELLLKTQNYELELISSVNNWTSNNI